MRIREDLVELSAYWIAVALSLPPLDLLSNKLPTLAITLAILVLFPAPLWLARLWILLPERVESLMFWHSTIVWATMGIALVVVVVGTAVVKLL